MMASESMREQVVLTLVVGALLVLAILTNAVWLAPTYLPAAVLVVVAASALAFILFRERPRTRSGMIATPLAAICIGDLALQAGKGMSGDETAALLLWVNHSPYLAVATILTAALLIHAAMSREERAFLRAATAALLPIALGAIPAFS